MKFEHKEPINYYRSDKDKWYPCIFLRHVINDTCVIQCADTLATWYASLTNIKRRDNSLQADNPNIAFKKRQS